MNPVGMGITLAVLPRLWGWVFVDCELMRELEIVQFASFSRLNIHLNFYLYFIEQRFTKYSRC